MTSVALSAPFMDVDAQALEPPLLPSTQPFDTTETNQDNLLTTDTNISEVPHLEPLLPDKQELLLMTFSPGVADETKLQILAEHPDVAAFYNFTAGKPSILNTNSTNNSKSSTSKTNSTNANEGPKPPKRANTGTDSSKKALDYYSFTAPPARLTARKPILLNPKGVQTRNNFNALQEESINDPSTSQTTSSANQSNATPKAPSPPKIKPIHIVRGNNDKKIIQDIAAVDKKFTYTTSENYLKVFPSDYDSHRRIASLVKDSDLQGFILPMGQVKPLKVVIRGLPHNTKADDLKEQLNDIGYEPFKVT